MNGELGRKSEINITAYNYDLDKRLSLPLASNSAVPIITGSTIHIPNILRLILQSELQCLLAS